jgi:DnaK suppressor protein
MTKTITKTILRKLEKVLIARKEEILSKNVQTTDIDIDGDDVDEIQGKIIAHIISTVGAREKQRLDKIDRAILKIKNNQFGTCEDCEEDIGVKRLEANPEFSVCIGCAERIELENKQKARGFR